MHIIVVTGLNTGEAEYKNMGDVAMLQMAVKRLLLLRPDARIDVLTDSPAELSRFCPGATPLPRRGCAVWQRSRFFLGRHHQRLPRWVSRSLSSLKWAIGTRWPTLVDRLALAKCKLRDSENLLDSLITCLDALDHCDLLLVCGSGGFADSCRDWNLYALGAMSSALARGKKVAMLGQGMGPLTDAGVLGWAKHVFPRLSLIGLRGTRGGEQMLASLGVSRSSIRTTGDDAIELANAIAPGPQHRAIGINLRVAQYSGVDSTIFEDVRSALRQSAQEFNADVLPIPITFHDYANDVRSLRELLAEIAATQEVGLTLDTPLKVMRQTARCRVVITGAYHAAVFALAQGIPAVCIHNSNYYSAKFDGLKECFPNGCWTLSSGDSGFREKLAYTINEAWTSADAVQEYLLKSAEHQIEAGRAAYRELVAPAILQAKTAFHERL